MSERRCSRCDKNIAYWEENVIGVFGEFSGCYGSTEWDLVTVKFMLCDDCATWLHAQLPGSKREELIK
jgi:hypothetical protein